MLPVLKLFAEGKSSVPECIDDIKKQFSITDEEAEELIPSGRMSLLYNRVHWARTYLGKAGLLRSPKRGTHEITNLGIKFLEKNPTELNAKTLTQFKDFQNWKEKQSTNEFLTSGTSEKNLFDDEQTPEDAMQSASNLLNAALRDELINALVQMNPTRFESIILELLSAMGFGKGREDYGSLTPTSGDGGIDGVISEDALGLDAVYIQAKCYNRDNKVSRPDIQRFVGSLTGESATKGVFVTTSDFSKEAKAYIDRVQQRIVLINGDKLAKLMIQHDVGVRTRATYRIKSLDEDFFSTQI